MSNKKSEKKLTLFAFYLIFSFLFVDYCFKGSVKKDA